MRILVASNLYPPHHIGGYELGCRDVVDALRARGHDVAVLTSRFGLARSAAAPNSAAAAEPPSNLDDEAHVHRRLPISLGLPFGAKPPAFVRMLLESEARAWLAMRRLIADARPDVVYVWNLRYLPISIVRYARRASIPVCAFVSDDWLAHWETVDRWEQWSSHLPNREPARAAKRLLRAVVNRVRLAGRGRTTAFDRVQFASEFLRRGCLDAGIDVTHASVVHWGVDPARFAPRGRSDSPDDGIHGGEANGGRLRLLYAGQVTRAKGVETAIEAVRLLLRPSPRPAARALTDGSGLEFSPRLPIELSIVGGSVQPDYEAALQARVREAGLASDVRFVGMVDRARMPDIYRAHDVLLLPSIWDEPFSITLLEAMASGLAIVATPTGGSAEILRDDHNALVFAPGDATACARCMQALIDDPARRVRLGAEARRTIEQAFTLDRMIARLEAELRVLASGAQPREG